MYKTMKISPEKEKKSQSKKRHLNLSLLQKEVKNPEIWGE